MNQDGERNLKKANSNYQNNIYEFHYKVNLVAEIRQRNTKLDEA